MLEIFEAFETTDGLIKLTKYDKGLNQLFFSKANGKNQTN